MPLVHRVLPTTTISKLGNLEAEKLENHGWNFCLPEGQVAYNTVDE